MNFTVLQRYVQAFLRCLEGFAWVLPFYFLTVCIPRVSYFIEHYTHVQLGYDQSLFLNVATMASGYSLLIVVGGFGLWMMLGKILGSREDGRLFQFEIHARLLSALAGLGTLMILHQITLSILSHALSMNRMVPLSECQSAMAYLVIISTQF